MKKINIKKIITIALIILFIILLSTKSFALIDTNSYAPEQPTVDETEKITEIGGKLIGTLQNIGIIIAVIMITVIGLKYILGSVEERAEYQKTMIPFLVGAIMIIATTTIVSYIYNVSIETEWEEIQRYANSIQNFIDLEHYLEEGYPISRVPDETIINLYRTYSEYQSSNPDAEEYEYPNVKRKIVRELVNEYNDRFLLDGPPEQTPE